MNLFGVTEALALAAFVALGSVNDTNANPRAVESSSSGVPMLSVDGKRRIVRPPGAVIQGVIVTTRSAVRRPSVSPDVSMDKAALTGGLYSIVTIRVDNVMAGHAPSVVDVYWNQYVRRDDDGRALHSSSVSDAGTSQPLVPGLHVVARIAPNAGEYFGGSVDRESGLWDFRARPYFMSPYEQGAFSAYTFSDELKEALLEGSLSSGVDDVYSMITLSDPTETALAIAELTAEFEAATKVWDEYRATSRE